MLNIELKAKISDYEKICKVAEELSGRPPTLIYQDDTFYEARIGSLKLELNADSSATLLGDPNLGDHRLLVPATKAGALSVMLKKSIGIRKRIVKERKVFVIDQSRIHIDNVKDVGHIMELEVVLRPKQTLDYGMIIAYSLLTKLGVKDEDILDD